VVRAPVFTDAGRLLTEPGYDAASQIYYAPPADLRIPFVPEAPDAPALAAARGLLLELLADFPFVGPADRAHALALLLTPFLRELIAGDVPMVVVSKSTPRTGASLLVRVAALVQDGAPPAPKTVSPVEEEMRKRCTAFLLGAPTLVLFDNLHGRLDSAALAAILTCGGWWTDRLLGHTQEIRVPVRAMFCLTGNNPVLSGELAARSVLVRLDAKMADPATRTGFRHPALDTWVLAQGGALVAAALTLGQAWLAAGRPTGPRVAFGGFQEWADVLGGVLAHAGLPGLLTNRRQLVDQADDEGRTIRAFLGAWLDAYGETRQAVRALLDTAREHALPIASATEHGLVIRLGRLLASIEDRRYALEDGPTVAVGREGGRSNGVFWRLRRVPQDGECGESGESVPANRITPPFAPALTGGDSSLSPYSSPPLLPGPTPEWVTEDSAEGDSSGSRT
jgi:putative DNA primase/helicase